MTGTEMGEKMETDSAQWCPVKGGKAMCSSWTTGRILGDFAVKIAEC